ncbi:hypothetical protein L7F22_015714 [Adiantum nelumboides]|nr:hypothetical protein [Adiantum nelumboides]
MASGEGKSNPSTTGDVGGDNNEDYGNEYGPPLLTQEELHEMEHRRLVGEATNMMLNFAKDPKLAKYMTETAFQDVHAQWKATTTSPPKPDSKKQYSEKELEEEVEARLAQDSWRARQRQKARQKAEEKHRFSRLHGYIKNLMDASGLKVREDGVGNIFGRWEGSDSSAAGIATGSHIDAIPFSGKYDGVVGLLGAIEAINVLNRTGFKPKRSIDIIMFTSEEPTRFGISCLGSRLLAGVSNMKALLEKAVDKENVSFPDAAAVAGYELALETLLEVPLEKNAYAAFVELHIEQGPILEEEGVAIGVVTAIAAPASLKVDYKGNGGHAGAVLMPSRNDAGLAAAELALAVEKHVLETNSIDTVGTTGVLELFPGAVNSIPSIAHLEIDVRDIDEQRRNTVILNIKASASEIAARRGVFLDFEIMTQDPPAESSRWVVKSIESSSQQLGLKFKHMKSRAYHDSLFMARVSPMGMIFIPCYKGRLEI